MIKNLIDLYKKHKEYKRVREEYIGIITEVLKTIPDSDIIHDTTYRYYISGKNKTLGLFCHLLSGDCTGQVKYNNTLHTLLDHETVYFYKIMKVKYNNNILQQTLDEENRKYLDMVNIVEEYKSKKG